MYYKVSILENLKNDVEIYLKRNNSRLDFDEFVLEQVKLGLNKEIHKTKRSLKESILCPDSNPKSTRLVFDMSHKFEYFLCNSCSKDHKYDSPTTEESIEWG